MVTGFWVVLGVGLYKRCYEICYENFIATVGCGLSELWDYRITRRTWILILFFGNATGSAIGNATDSATGNATDNATGRAIDDATGSATDRAIEMCTNDTQKLILAEFKNGMQRTQDIATDSVVKVSVKCCSLCLLCSPPNYMLSESGQLSVSSQRSGVGGELSEPGFAGF